MSAIGAQKIGGIVAAGGLCSCLLLLLASSQSPLVGSGSVFRPSTTTKTSGPIPAIPALEPQEISPLSRDLARAANDAIPINGSGLEQAPSFASVDELTLPAAYRAALDCLTAAVYYEAAGENSQGQKSVAQVVLNRVRHPAFPATVCEVVYQGSERRTGCQFTFTCDGSLRRQPSRNGWDRARRVAEAALGGTVEPSVGMATHYHTDWVFPYWAERLDKVAAVGSHLFYRWTGYWGRRSAFTQRYVGESVAEKISYPETVLGSELDGLMGMAAIRPPEDPLTGLVPTSDAALKADDLVVMPAADVATGRLLADAEPGRLMVDELGS